MSGHKVSLHGHMRECGGGTPDPRLNKIIKGGLINNWALFNHLYDKKIKIFFLKKNYFFWKKIIFFEKIFFKLDFWKNKKNKFWRRS